MEERVIKVGVKGRDEITLTLSLSGTEVIKKTAHMVGCNEMLKIVRNWWPSLTGQPSQWPLPEGDHHGAILLREMILKAQSRYSFPYDHEELCHCRMILTTVVDEAILYGAHAVDAVSRQTSAGTSCGSCQPDIKKIISYRCLKPS